MAGVMMRERLRDSQSRSSALQRDCRQTLRRVIIKQGYLKKLPNSAKIGSSFKKAEQRWFVFGVMNNTDPYLEYYSSEEQIFTGSPINILFLDSCSHIVKQHSKQRYDFMFTVVLRERHLSLVAQSKQGMKEWCRAIEEKLTELGIMEEPGDGHNDYINPPHSRPMRESRQDRSLTMVPESNGEMTHPLSQNRANQDTESLQTPPLAEATANQNGDRGEEETYEPLWAQGDSSEYTTPALVQVNNQQRDYENFSIQNGASAPQATTPVSPSQHSLHHLPSFEESMAASPGPFSCSPPAGAVGGSEPPFTPGPDFSVLSPKMREALGLDEENPAADAVHGWDMPPSEEMDAPPPYIPKKVLERNANKSLKMTQVECLRREMLNTAGVQVILRRVDCYHALGFVDCFGAVWVAGWNQAARPYLNNAIHIGDQIVSINSQVVENSRMAHKLIKHCSEEDRVVFLIRRMPKGKVFAIRRLVNGESLGLSRKGGTAEIVTVHPEGLAAQHGLTSKATTMDGENFCNWCLTEINSRPLNLNFKDNEIEHRLNAVGRDISVVVHPLDFMAELKQQLKATYKNYKDFLVQ